jgi:hypothetical protein
VPADSNDHLSSATLAGENAAAGVGRLELSHLQPGTDPDAAVRAARSRCGVEILVAEPGLVLDV